MIFFHFFFWLYLTGRDSWGRGGWGRCAAKATGWNQIQAAAARTKTSYIGSMFYQVRFVTDFFSYFCEYSLYYIMIKDDQKNLTCIRNERVKRFSGFQTHHKSGPQDINMTQQETINIQTSILVTSSSRRCCHMSSKSVKVYPQAEWCSRKLWQRKDLSGSFCMCHYRSLVCWFPVCLRLPLHLAFVCLRGCYHLESLQRLYMKTWEMLWITTIRIFHSVPNVTLFKANDPEPTLPSVRSTHLHEWRASQHV